MSPPPHVRGGERRVPGAFWRAALVTWPAVGVGVEAPLWKRGRRASRRAEAAPFTGMVNRLQRRHQDHPQHDHDDLGAESA